MQNKRIMVPIKVPNGHKLEEIAVEIDHKAEKVLMTTMDDYLDQHTKIDMDLGKVIFTFEQFKSISSLVLNPDTAKILYGEKV